MVVASYQVIMPLLLVAASKLFLLPHYAARNLTTARAGTRGWTRCSSSLAASSPCFREQASLGHEGAPMVTLARGGVRVSISGAFCSPGGLMNRENDGVTVVSPP